MGTMQILLIFIFATIAGMGSCLDEMQTHRPLIACTVTGLILGDMTTGIIIGGTLEMMALGWMNIGAAIAPDAALASVISTILVIASHQDVATGIAIAMPLAAAGQGVIAFKLYFALNGDILLLIVVGTTADIDFIVRLEGEGCFSLWNREIRIQ